MHIFRAYEIHKANEIQNDKQQIVFLLPFRARRPAARKHSPLSVVVVKFSRARKRYERQGVLVEGAALDKAQEECLSDEEVRARRREREAARRLEEDEELVQEMAGKIRAMFPRCPSSEALAIARHTALRGSGRVGRSASGRALDEHALRLAVIASIRHAHTPYASC